MRPIDIASAAIATTCPKCKQPGLKVLETRLVENGTVRRRRRACTLCEHRYTTYEVDQDFYRKAKDSLIVLDRIQSCFSDAPVGGPEKTVKKPQRTCEQCFHMAHYGCAFDFPEAGGSFAEECSMFTE